MANNTYPIAPQHAGARAVDITQTSTVAVYALSSVGDVQETTGSGGGGGGSSTSILQVFLIQ